MESVRCPHLSTVPAWQLVGKVERAGYAASMAHTLGGVTVVEGSIPPMKALAVLGK